MFPLKEVLTFDSMLFWLLAAITALTILATMPLKKNIRVGWGVGATVCFLVLLAAFGPHDLIGTVRNDPWRALAYCGGYVLIGTLFGCWKWDALLVKRRDKAAEAERTWMNENHPGQGDKVPDNPELVEAFKAHLREDPYWTVPVKPKSNLSMWQLFTNFVGFTYYETSRASTERMLRIIPRPWHYKQQWFAWSAWWPISGLWYLIVELGGNVFNAGWRFVSVWMEKWSFYRLRDYKRFE